MQENKNKEKKDFKIILKNVKSKLKKGESTINSILKKLQNINEHVKKIKSKK